MATDGAGQSARATWRAKRTSASLQDAASRSNLIVPLVGNFAGPKALRAVGAYLRAHGATVTTFYTSNVEQYLFQDGIWADFARNVATLPLDDDEHVHPLVLQQLRVALPGRGR